MVVPPQRDGGQRSTSTCPCPNASADSLAPLLTWMREHLAEDLPVRTLAGRAAMSERTFARRFVAETGTTPGKWLLAQRLHHARELLETRDLAVETVAARAGFGSAALLRHHFGGAGRGRAGRVPAHIPDAGRARRLSSGPLRSAHDLSPGAVADARTALAVPVPRARGRPRGPRCRGVRRRTGLLRATERADLLRAARRPVGRPARSTSPTSGWTRRTRATEAATLWAIPKGLCDFRGLHGGREAWIAPPGRTLAGRPDRRARFTDIAGGDGPHAVQGGDLAAAAPSRGPAGGRRRAHGSAAACPAGVLGVRRRRARSAGWPASDRSRRSG